MNLTFNYIDYLVLTIYALVLLYVGFRFSRKEKNQQDIFLGGAFLKMVADWILYFWS